MSYYHNPFRDLERQMRPFREMERELARFTERAVDTGLEVQQALASLGEPALESQRELARRAERTVGIGSEAQEALAGLGESALESPQELARLAERTAGTGLEVQQALAGLGGPALESEQELTRLAERTVGIGSEAQHAVASLAEQFHGLVRLPEDYAQLLSAKVPDLSQLDHGIGALQGVCEELMGSFATSGLGNHFLEQAARTVSLAGLDSLNQSIGLLSTVTPFTSGTFMWSSGGSTVLHPGAWSSSRPQSATDPDLTAREVEVGCEVDCMICGQPLLASEARLFLTSNGEVKAKVAVFPLCSACTQAAGGSAEYWELAIEKLVEKKRRPRFVLLEGGSEASGPPKGRKILALVREGRTRHS